MNDQHEAKKQKTYHEAEETENENLLTSKLENIKFKCDEQYDFARDQIDIRTESMKAVLDEMRKVMFKQLDDSKNKIIK
jgi:hypothetical protein